MELLDLFFSFVTIIIRLFGVVAVFVVIIFIHEMGHYLVGRWCGIGASAFSIGFGPELWGFNDKRGTRWRIAAIPLGGYVKFIGDEDAASMPSKASAMQRSDSFAAATAWRRAATVFAGPLFNGILTVVLLAILFFFYGRPILAPIVTDVLPDMPASAAGFKPGDKIVTVQGEKITSFDEVSRYVMMHEGDTIAFVVERGGETLNLNVVPKEVPIDDGTGAKIRVGQIGVSSKVTPETLSHIRYGFFQSIGEGFKESSYIVVQTGKFLGRLIEGRADRCQLSGPVKSIQITWKVTESGFVQLVRLIAFFSLSIGLFNLLPIPPLDGGHLLFYIIEAVIGKPVKPAVQEVVFKAGLMVVLAFIFFAVINNMIPC
ncbi:RIP metalloprotease RseP [Bartonella sp. HY761]|uniref:RIP metalloprotease RseP n=1 Tax=Bartonella sp. HY761 TaxID=2979330 RepID=UPI0021FA100B|nr:RIP metalloprotease RseP [Bartonella sp. HY761]UXN07700.1 RIP metalloprotease RseP [Bartonella sp. HY761]